MSEMKMIEGLEQRLMLATAPRVVDVFADNRGTAWVTVDQPLKAATVNGKSVQILVKGRPRAATVSYNAKAKRIEVASNKDVKADSSYTLKLTARLLRGADGKKLDGEFKGNNQLSGNGKAGGDFVARTVVNKKTKVSRMVTDYGIMDLKLNHKGTPVTVKNFMGYANRGDWDGTFFHQLGPGVPPQFLFGGSFYIEGGDLNEVTTLPPIKHEPKTGNVFGTIAMNRDTNFDGDSAQKTWFFNLQDNRAIDNFRGGYAVFGKVANKESARTLRKLATPGTVDAGSNLNELPVKDADKVNAAGVIAKSDLIHLQRVSIEMALAAPAAPAAARTSLAATEVRVAATTMTVERGEDVITGMVSGDDGIFA